MKPSCLVKPAATTTTMQLLVPILLFPFREDNKKQQIFVVVSIFCINISLSEKNYYYVVLKTRFKIVASFRRPRLLLLLSSVYARAKTVRFLNITIREMRIGDLYQTCCCFEQTCYSFRFHMSVLLCCSCCCRSIYHI